jgi:Peptidase family M28/PDZ domain
MNRTIVFALLTLLTMWSAHAQISSPAITADELRAHVKYLASDELEGRGSGTEGNRKAAGYIANLMKSYGLEPAGDSGTFYQSFAFISTVTLGRNNTCSMKGKSVPGGTRVLQVDTDFRPLGFTTNDSVSGSMVFVGYGISAPDDKYDDFKDANVNGKVVVALRYGPDGSDPHSDLYKYTSFRNKARTAREHGAKAIIIISGPLDETEDELIKLSYDQSFASSGIIAVSMKRSFFDELLKSEGKDLKTIQEQIKETKQPQTMDLNGSAITLTTEVDFKKEKTANVVGYLPGNDPTFKDELVIVGAHFDHLGYGGLGSGSLVPDVHEIHNGADDNASGSAALLELEQAFAAAKASLKRSLLFIAFSGEELGTLGSAYYVNHPTFPLEKSIAMVNMDMIGRLQDRALTVYGTGTSPLWDDLLSKYNKDSSFILKRIPDGIGPSDHSQFYGKDMPVLFFFTGTHSDYHKPSDDWDKINYQGEEQVTRYVYRVVLDLDREPSKPEFSRVASTTTGGDNRGFRVTLGIVPDYGEGANGLKIGSIRPGGAAEKAGLKAGDLIVMMAGKKVLNIYDYMGVLGELKDGDHAEIEVMRDGKPLKVTALMQKRN